MQLLPKTGKTVAKQVKFKGYTAPQLYTPAVNLELGTRYFKDMVDKYNGQFEYALAAYNAGSDRVGDWLGQGHYRDAQEFVESIPSPKPANMSKRFCGMQAFTESYTERRSQFPKGPSRHRLFRKHQLRAVCSFAGAL